MRSACEKSACQTFRFNSFNAIRRQRTWSQLRQAVLTPERREHYAQHKNILDAISGRDAVQAEFAMRAHIEDVARSLLNPRK